MKFPLYLFCLTLCCAFGNETVPTPKVASDKVKQAEKIKTDLACSAEYHSTAAKQRKKGDVTFTFTNTGKKTLRLMDMSDEEDIIETFFLLTLEKADGKKMLLDDGIILCMETGVQTKYQELKSGESRKVILPLDQYFRKTYPSGLPKGEYVLNISYRNNWGKDCVTGKYPAPPIKFEVE